MATDVSVHGVMKTKNANTKGIITLDSSYGQLDKNGFFKFKYSMWATKYSYSTVTKTHTCRWLRFYNDFSGFNSDGAVPC